MEREREREREKEKEKEREIQESPWCQQDDDVNDDLVGSWINLWQLTGQRDLSLNLDGEMMSIYVSAKFM